MPRKMPVEYAGGQVDETLKPRTETLVSGLPDHKGLIEALKPLFGRYRTLRQSRETEPSHAEILRHTERTLNLLSELKEHLETTPEAIKAQIGLHQWRLLREIEPRPFGRLHQELDDVAMFARRAMQDAQGWVSKTGERPKREEHQLLSEVAELLEQRGLAKLDAAALAAGILESEGVRVPQEAAKARSAILAARKPRYPQD